MEEVLQKLLEAEVLSADTKKDLEAAFAAKISEAVEEVKEATTTEVKAELAEQWITERDALIEAIDSKVTEFLNDEFVELKEDINRFRDLEVEYAEKLTESKAQMSSELQGDMAQLVEKIDSFLEIRLTSELTELREDIQVQKENVFGRKIYEAVASEFSDKYAKDDDMSSTLAETETRLGDTAAALKESESKLAKIERSNKLTEVLSSLTGRKREVMEAILKNVSTSQLEEGYKTFIGRVLKETEESDEGKEVIKEDASADKSKIKKRKLPENLKVVTGDDEGKLNEEQLENKTQLSESAKKDLRKLAGLV